MRAIPVCFPVVVETAGTDRHTPLLNGVLGELVSVGQPQMMESGRHRTTIRVAARTEADARRRAKTVLPGAKIVEVGEPSALQHFTSQKALPYRRSLVYGRTKNARFNVQGGAAGHAKASPPVQPHNSPPAAGVGMGVGESLDELLGPAPVLEAYQPKGKIERAIVDYLDRTQPRTGSGAWWTSIDDLWRELGKRGIASLQKIMSTVTKMVRDGGLEQQDMADGPAVRRVQESLGEASQQQRDARERRRKQWRMQNPQLARKRALIAKRTGKKRAMKGKMARKKSMKRAMRYRGITDPNFESMQEAESPQDAAVNAALAYLKRRGHVSNGSQANSASQDFWFNNKQAQTAFPGSGAYKKFGDAVQKAFEAEKSESLITFAEIDAAAKRAKECPIDKAVRGYPLATQTHEALKVIPAEWFQSQRGRSVTVAAVDKVRMAEGDEPADALEDAYLHRKHVVSSLEEQPQDAVRDEHRFRVRFESQRSRDFATRNLMRYMEACTCADDDPDEENEALFTIGGASSAASAGHRLTDGLVKLNLSRHQIVELK